jgi:hypothetical protein
MVKRTNKKEPTNIACSEKTLKRDSLLLAKGKGHLDEKIKGENTSKKRVKNTSEKGGLNTSKRG